MTSSRYSAFVARGVKHLDALSLPQTSIDYRASATIFAQNDRCATVMYVQKGRVKLFATSPAGRRAVVGVVDPGEFFGEDGLSGQTQRSVTAQAMINSTIAVIDVQDMQAQLRREPRIAAAFIAHLLARNASLERAVADFTLNPAERRLARALVLLSRLPQRGNGGDGVSGISQSLLAEMVGASRSRVNRFMIKFRQLGLIRYAAGGGALRVQPSLLRRLRG